MKEKEKEEEILIKINKKLNHIRKRTSGETFWFVKILTAIANDEGRPYQEEETDLSTGSAKGLLLEV